MNDYGIRRALIASAKKLKDFDLKVGDLVTTHPNPYHIENYRVTGIYPHIFTVENIDNGLKTSFPKSDALTGVVRKCR